MADSKIIYGPKGCGKTVNGPGIAKAYGLTRVLELDEFPLAATGRTPPKLEPKGVLYLTYDDRRANKLSVATGIEAMTYDFALKQSRVRNPA